MCMQNFMNKTRVRASGHEHDGSEHSDDLLSDEELVVSHDRLEEATTTNVGGRTNQRLHGEDPAEMGLTHSENSTQAMGYATAVWAEEANPSRVAHRSIGVANLKDMFAAARVSQRGGDAAERLHPDVHRDPALHGTHKFSEADVKKWIETQSDVNPEQACFLKTVALHVLKESTQPNGTGKAGESVEPMRWLLHGKPGTGTSHAIQKLQAFFQDVVGYKKMYTSKSLLCKRPWHLKFLGTPSITHFTYGKGSASVPLPEAFHLPSTSLHRAFSCGVGSSSMR